MCTLNPRFHSTQLANGFDAVLISDAFSAETENAQTSLEEKTSVWQIPEVY